MTNVLSRMPGRSLFSENNPAHGNDYARYPVEIDIGTHSQAMDEGSPKGHIAVYLDSDKNIQLAYQVDDHTNYGKEAPVSR